MSEKSRSSIPPFSPDGPEAMFYEADLMIERGKITEATRLLMELIEKFPAFGRAYNHLGYIYETKFRDITRAEAYYKKALELAPDYPGAYLNFSILLSNQERWDDLKQLLTKALSCPGIHKGKIHSEFGIMHEIRGEFDAAVESFKAAIRYSFTEAEVETYKAAIRRVLDKKIILN